MDDQIDFLIRNIPNLLFGFPNNRPGGLLMTVLLSVVSLAVGMALALVVGIAQDSQRRSIRWLARTYVQIFRGVPLILLLLIVQQGLAAGWLGFTASTLVSAFVTLILYSSAYQADIIASGLRSVPTQLVEDSRLMGLSASGSYLSVKVAYGLRVMKPAFLSQAITTFKDSSVVVVLGVADLTTTARIALGTDVNNAPFWVATYLTVGAMYFAVAFGVSQIAERRWRVERSHQLVDIGLT